MRVWLALFFLFMQGPGSDAALQDRLWRHRNLGKAFYENPTTQAQAVVEFKKALDLDPESKREQLNYALALLHAGKTEEAVQLLQKVQAKHPELPHTWFNLGITFKKAGEFDKALPQFEKLVQLAPAEPVAHYNLGVIYKQAGRGTDAIREFQTASTQNPALAAPRFQLYNLYRTTQRPQDAARELSEFQRLKKSQEGAAIPEDMEWCDYAEIYDPLDAAPKQTLVQPLFDERPLPTKLAIKAIKGSDDIISIVMSSDPFISGAKAGAAGDYDNDGRLDLAIVTATGVSLCHNDGPKFTCSEFLKGTFEGVAWVDYDHDYDLDLFVFGAESRLMRNQGTAGFADHTADFPFVKAKALAGHWLRALPDSKAFDIAVTYDQRDPVLYRDQLNGRYESTKLPPGLDLKDPLAPHLSIASDGSATLRTPRLPAQWLRVQLEGVKNLKLAQGSIVEVKAGSLYARRQYEGRPLLFDLGAHTEADTVRITWPNGLIQNETHQAARKAYVYKEAQRLSGSCPMIWTWNGHEFEFLTDVLGIAPLGASSGDGSYFPVDHDEYVQIPAAALALKDGGVELRVTEELAEVTYLDQAQLWAVDHPASTEIFTSEKWKSPPFPEFRFYEAKRRVYAYSAVDDTGHDVRQLVSKRDRRYPSNFRRTENGVGITHTLTLDFGAAASDNRAVLILNGWVDWADGSTFLQAAQASMEGLMPPSLQVQDDRGQWRTVIEDMGMPDGKPKTIAVDLTGKFISSRRTVRIVTNLCIYWDEIFLSESSAAPSLRQTELPNEIADLHFRGFSATKIEPARLQPDSFFYQPASSNSFWNPTPGRYTRYGDVRELLRAVDDRMVVMGAGDEIRLRFDARALPALPTGWTREYLMKVDGWAKDRDANTAYSQTVEPLPFHAMSQYPYPKQEHFPADMTHREYLEKYNTRPALRLIRPLHRSGSSSE